MIKKYFLYLAFIVLLLVSAIAFLLYGDYNKKVDEISNNAENILSVESQKLIFALDDVRTDLKYLAQKFQTQSTTDIANDFTSFSMNKRKYDQIRFLDLKGMEKIRINYFNSKAYIVSEDKLQSKKNRYYFVNSIQSPRNSIYISQLDLNVEHASIEVPIKPTIRFSTTVYDNKNKKIGIVILNYLAADILEALKSVRDDFIGDIYLLNSDGYYLIAKDSVDEWGFMFHDRSDSSFKYRFKEIWNYISSNNFGTYKNDNGMFFFRTINLDKSLDVDNTVICGSCIWKMVVFIPNSYLYEELFKKFLRYLPLNIGVFFILAFSLWILLVNKQRRKEHAQEIQRLNKQIINERDIFVAGPTVVFKLKNAYGWPVEYVSENVKDVLGYEADEFKKGKLDYASIILPEHISNFSESVAVAKKDNTTWFEHEPYEVVRKDGKHIWLSDSVFLIRDDNDNVTYLYGYILDISALKAAEKVIEDNSRYVKTVIDTIADPTVVIDVNTYEVTLYNKAAKELYIGKREMPALIKCHQLSHSCDLPCVGEDNTCPINKILSTKKKIRVTHKHYKQDGSPIFVELIAIPILDVNNNVVQIIESHRDITHHLETENALKELASTDKLTQAYNRTKFDEILERNFQVEKDDFSYFGLIMYDIDHFKDVNDTYGHDVGDSVLVEMTDIVKKLIRKHDILVRWGGEEFIVYIPDSDNKILTRISEHLRRSIQEYKFKGVNQTITVSLGSTVLRNDDTVESLLKRVDTALYTSKKNGRNINTLL